jgi:hypothetical protein
MVSALEKTGSPPDAVTIASVFFKLGNADRGFKWLTRAFDEISGASEIRQVPPDV